MTATMNSYSFRTPKGNQATVFKVKGVGRNVTGFSGFTSTVAAYAVVNAERVPCAASDFCTTYAAVKAAGF